jgi:hypothetical protein
MDLQRETSCIQYKRRKVDSIVHTLSRNCLQKHVIEGKLEGRIEVTRRRKRRRTYLLSDLKKNKGSCKLREGKYRPHSMENWLWKRLWTSCKTDYRMNDE